MEEINQKEKVFFDKLEELKECPYCASLSIAQFLSAPDRLGGQPGLFHLSRCHECTLVFQNPRIKEEYIGDFYTDEIGYFRAPSMDDEKSSFSQKFRGLLWKQTLIQHFKYENMGRKNVFWWLATAPFSKVLNIQLVPKFVKGGKLLEIGCSNGSNLEKLQSYGWEVEGVEMSEATAEYARTKRKLKVATGRIENADFKDHSFDVIVMSMVLEHLYNPFEKLKMVDRWLKPGGQLLFSIPWFEGFEFGIFQEYSYGLQLPTHITFLNRETIIKNLNKLGYKNIKFHHHFFDRDVVASSDYKYMDTNKWRYKFIARNKILRLICIKPLVFGMSLLGRTSRVSVHAMKG